MHFQQFLSSVDIQRLINILDKDQAVIDKPALQFDQSVLRWLKTVSISARSHIAKPHVLFSTI